MTTLERVAIDELARRATAAAQAWRPGARIGDLVVLDGGRSSLTYRACVAPAGDWVVLKVAPAGIAPIRNRDVLRQARLLEVLVDVHGIKVPRVLFSDAGDPPHTPPFFGMTFVPGTSFEPHLTPVLEASSNEDVAARAREAARLLATLHRPETLARVGDDESVLSLPHEIARWERAFATVPTVAADMAGRAIDGLRANLPTEESAVIVHGDFRLGNMLSEGGTVTAVIDWEIWSLSDPRLDLGWFLLCAGGQRLPTAVRNHPGMPSPHELADEYCAAGGRSMLDIPWFSALALTKMAATTALIAKHDLRSGKAELAARTRAQVAPMLEGALAVLDPAPQRRSDR